MPVQAAHHVHARALMRRWGFLLLASCWACLLFGQGNTDARIDTLNALKDRDAVDTLARTARRMLGELPHGPAAVRYEAEWHLAHALGRQDDPLGALAHAQQALLTARDLGDTARILGSLYQLTKLNVQGRHYDEADAFRRRHLALARDFARDSLQLALALNSMGSMHSRLLHGDSAEAFYREGLRVLDDRSPVLKQALRGNLASLIAADGRHDEAAALLRQVIAEMDPGDLSASAWSYSNLGQALLHGGRYREALAAFGTADSLNLASGNALDLAIDLAELRADALDSLGDPAGAYRMIKLARDLQDTLFERSMNEQLLELEERFGTRLKEEEIQRLDAQAREQGERLRLRNAQLWGSLALALLAIVAVVLVLRNLRQRRRHMAALEALNTTLQDQQERIEQINRLLRLKVLRTQINPHFIYNCLHAIGDLVRQGDAAAAIGYLDGFARLLRMVLDHSVKDRVPISEEIAFLRQYLQMESLRFADGLHYAVDADAELLEEDAPVPALLVQPFVENAIWHGLAHKTGEKRVVVHFAGNDGRLTCTVEDNGVGRAAAVPRSHSDGSASMGLQLTNERLQLLTHQMDGRASFTDLEQDGRPAGTRVEVVLQA